MANERIIGPFRFPSKAKAREEIRKVLHGASRDTPLEGTDYELIRGLLDCHPDAAEKIGCGVQSIEVRSIEYGHPGFWIVREDGTGDDFSYKVSLDGAPNHRAQVLSALRQAVRHQLNDHRQEHFFLYADTDGSSVCPLTGLKIFADRVEVDHVEPFGDLAEQFVARHGGYTGIIIGSSLDHPGAALADDGQVTDWLAYHEQNARLRVVHPSANRSRGYIRTSA